MTLAAVAGCGGPANPARDLPAGPLQPSSLGGRLGIAYPNGERFATEFFRVRNTGTQDLTLESVELVTEPRGFRLLDTFIGGIDRGVTDGSAPWPKHRRRFRDRHPVTGYTLPPETSVTRTQNADASVTFVIEPTGNGKYEFPDVDIHYRIGDQRYARRMNPSLLICTYPGKFRDVSCVKR